MPDPTKFLLGQAEASPHIQFIYELAAQRVAYVNAAYEHQLGGRRAQATAELPALLARLHPEHRPVWGIYWRLWCQGQLHDEVELRLLSPGQADQWFCLTPHHERDADGRTWLSGTLRDISSAKLNQALNDKYSARKNTTLELLAHDLAGALGLLQQLGEYVQAELGPHPNTRVPEALALMLHTTQRSAHLIRDLVSQELQESAEVPLKLERADLRESLAQVLDTFANSPAPAPRLHYTLPARPVPANVDVSKLMQVVINLVVNACKFTPDAGHIRVALVAVASAVHISVADDGIGIAGAMLPVLFERFTPAGRLGLRGEPSTGLGLSLCRRIVALHGGTLSVASTEGQGSTFTIELPALAA